MSTAVVDTTASALRMFEEESRDLRMTVLLDQDLYRHVSFTRPVSSLYRFDLITWPGSLVIHGDMGTYAFSRTADMFGWFGTGPINPGYWAQKLTAADPSGGVREYSKKLFWRHVNEILADLDTRRANHIRTELAGQASWDVDFDDQASAFTSLRDYPEFEDA